MDSLAQLLLSYDLFAYPLIIVASVIEGLVTALAVGALSREGYLVFGEAFIVAIIGAHVHDILFWWVGKKLRPARRKKFFFIRFDKLTLFLEKIKDDMGMYVFASKFAWNLNRFVLAAAGYSGMPLKKLLRHSSPAAIIWVTLMMSLGYVFADQTKLFQQRIEIAGLIIAGIIIGIIVLQSIVWRYIKQYFKLNGLVSQKQRKLFTKKNSVDE